MVNLIESLRSNLIATSNLIFKLDKINNIASIIIEAYRNGNKVLICGNGGSAVDAEHFAAELVSKFKIDRKGLNAIALSSNVAVITAIANDYDYEEIFSRQVIAYAEKGDVVIGLSTSGESINVLKALDKAKELDAIPILITGKVNKYYDYDILSISSKDTARIQEVYLLVIHMICELVEDELFEK